MGNINAANTLTFKSSESLFGRVQEKLDAYKEAGVFDTGTFHFYVKQVLGNWGLGARQECEAILHVKNRKAKLPDNFKTFHAAYRCTFNYKGSAKSINEQKPWIYYYDAEISKESTDRCKIECCKDNEKDKLVVRTYVNGEDTVCQSTQNRRLNLSPNVVHLAEDQEQYNAMFSPGCDEITIKDGYVHTTFDEDSIYLQYFGIAVDEYGLPMIPDNEHMELAIEYYIYSMIFEKLYWSSVPNVVSFLRDAEAKYDYNNRMAVAWVKLPSFQSMVNSIRRSRNNKKFYNLGEYRTQG